MGLPFGYTYTFGEGSGDSEVFGVDLPCINHDRCYWTCGVSQANCDAVFRIDMIATCMANGNDADQAYCVGVAETYALGGQSEQGFLNGQNRSCVCGRAFCP